MTVRNRPIRLLSLWPHKSVTPPPPINHDRDELIKRLVADGANRAGLAKRYGVTRARICQIVRHPID